MRIRYAGAVLSATAMLTVCWWALTKGSHVTAIAGGIDVPLIGFVVAILGFFLWMIGMARAERLQWSAWAELDRRQAPPGYMDTFVFEALAAVNRSAPPAADAVATGRSEPRAVGARGQGYPAVPGQSRTASGPGRADRVPSGYPPARADRSRPGATESRSRAAESQSRRPRPSPVALAVLDSIRAAPSGDRRGAAPYGGQAADAPPRRGARGDAAPGHRRGACASIGR